ncbi:unnamed protein product [Rotaria sp. Silwood1]|nr:unnamed protein product [Rotaria sp. Silwood1]CAF1686427.1 unnamed protein product [Rotaria sp. Silwood1]CAF5014255.1 unnamed protein product [Rotaria sp. Silwood1]
MSTTIKAGLISNITAKLAANLHIDEIAINSEHWADDAVKIEDEAKKKLAKDNEKRSCELAADFTHLQLQSIHKIMTLKFALNQTL